MAVWEVVAGVAEVDVDVVEGSIEEATCCVDCSTGGARGCEAWFSREK